MNRFRPRKIYIRAFKLADIFKKIKALLPLMGFFLAINILCAAGVINTLESLAKLAGTSDRVFNTVLALELRRGFAINSTDKTLLSAAFPDFSAYSTNRRETVIAEHTNSPDVLQTPSSTPAPSPAAKLPPPKQKAVISEEFILLKGETEGIEVSKLINEPLSIGLNGKPEILIIHTHSTEAYLWDGLYKEAGKSRTLDLSNSVLRVGDELAAALKESGFSVIHDRGIYDYPGYTGSYERSMNSITAYLKKYPSIKIVLDIHRDAASDSEGAAVKTSAIVNGANVSQIMLVIGKGSGNLTNPNWKENLKLAMRLQSVMNSCYKGIMRPILISQSRYNEQASPGSLLIEIGCNGNTLDESIASARLLAEAFKTVLVK